MYILWIGLQLPVSEYSSCIYDWCVVPVFPKRLGGYWMAVPLHPSFPSFFAWRGFDHGCLDMLVYWHRIALLEKSIALQVSWLYHDILQLFLLNIHHCSPVPTCPQRSNTTNCQLNNHNFKSQLIIPILKIRKLLLFFLFPYWTFQVKLRAESPKKDIGRCKSFVPGHGCWNHWAAWIWANSGTDLSGCIGC